MTVKLEKELLLWLADGRPAVLVEGPVLFSCDTDDEAIVLKQVLELLPEMFGFAKALTAERLTPLKMAAEAWAFVVNASSRYELDDGSTLERARAAIAPAEAAELEEMAGVVRSCRECGCTEDNACAGPCYWVELDLCSACYYK